MLTVFYFIGWVLAVVAVVILLDLTPESMTKDIITFLEYDSSFTVLSNEARGKTTGRKLTRELNAIRYALQIMNKERQFAIVCTISLGLLIAGMIVSVLIGNWLLAPILGITLAAIPFIYVKSSLGSFEKMMNEELETSLSIITTSYVRNDDIVASVRENIAYIKPPVKNIMISFVNQATVISSDIKAAIYDLKGASNNYIFKEWCDALISCQDDRTQKTTLLPIVSKFTDIRQVNGELQTMIISPRSEYFTMAALLILNFPLIYFINKDWFAVLSDTIPGKIAVAIVFVVLVVTAVMMFRITKPLEYKK
ncbi:MAG: hypothetical protein IKN56_02360 [Clostridia bacterium]|nr:hypothetical protein [Clostridia bacterium]